MPRSVFPRQSLTPWVSLSLSLAFVLFVRSAPALAAPAEAPATPAATVATQDQRVFAQGTVSDVAGKPLKGASVTVFNVSREGKPLPQVVVQTDAAGHFAIEASLSKDFLGQLRQFLKVDETNFSMVVLVHAPGYAVAQKVLKGSAQNGPNLPPNELKVARGFDASGRIVDAEGKPVAGATAQAQSVQLEGQNMESPEGFIWFQALTKENPFLRDFQATSDAQGNFTLHDLPPGKLGFSITDARFITQGGQIKVAGNTPNPGPAQTFTMRRGAKLSGRVLYPDGKPVAKATITASNVASRNRATSDTATTKDDGTYEFPALEEGKTIVSVAAPSEEWAKTSAPPLEVVVGKANTLGDLTLERGQIISGYVRDAETKAPIAGVVVDAIKDNQDTTSTKTDAEGKYQFRVQPGQYRFYIEDTPADYLRSYDNQPELAVTKATLVAPEFLMRRGGTLTGTAKDENGQPAVGATITVNNYGPDATATVDAQGNWTLRGLDTVHDIGMGKGNVQLRVSGPWGIRGNDKVKVPSPPLALTLNHIKLQDVKVRIVTPQGQPVPNAVVGYRFYMTSADNTWQDKTATSDDKGEVLLQELRPERAFDLTATQKGYMMSQKGRVTRGGDGLLKATRDVIMLPMDAKVSGRVVDAAGQPTVGARVVCLFPNDLRDLPDSSVLTDAQGQFTLQGLPRGEVVIGVAKGRAFGQGKVQANGTLELKLSAEVPALAPQDSKAAFALLEQWVNTAQEGRGQNGLPDVAMTLANYDTERAQRAMTDAQDNVNQRFATDAPVLVAHTDASRAVAWSKTLLPLIKDDAARMSTRLRTAALVATADPVWARGVYDEIAPGIAPTEFSSQSAVRYAQLAGLASALKDPDAEGWLQALTLCINAMKDDERSESMAQLIAPLANGDVAMTRRWIAQLPLLLQVRALSSLVSWGVRYNMPVAQQALSDLSALIQRPDFPTPKPRNDDDYYEMSPRDTLNSACTRVARALLTKDARAAQAFLDALPPGTSLDDDIETRIRARTAGAQDESKVKSALEAANNDWQMPGGKMAVLASLVSETLPQVSAQAFKDARDKLANHREGSDGESGALYAYARADFDPAESRLLLESEWLRLTTALREAKQAEKQDGNWWQTQEQVRAVVQAMLPLSAERTSVMLQEVQALSEQMQWYIDDIRRQMVAWLLLDAPARRAMPPQTDNYGDDMGG